MAWRSNTNKKFLLKVVHGGLGSVGYRSHNNSPPENATGHVLCSTSLLSVGFQWQNKVLRIHRHTRAFFQVRRDSFSLPPLTYKLNTHTRAQIPFTPLVKPSGHTSGSDQMEHCGNNSAGE